MIAAKTNVFIGLHNENCCFYFSNYTKCSFKIIIMTKISKGFPDPPYRSYYDDIQKILTSFNLPRLYIIMLTTNKVI